MKLLPSNNKGLSLVELLMATLIFSITATGFFVTFSGQRETSNRSERRLQAAQFGRHVFEDLRAKVDSRNWDSGDLQVGNHSLTSGPYTATYTVTEDPLTGVRRVDLTITWNEP